MGSEDVTHRETCALSSSERDGGGEDEQVRISHRERIVGAARLDLISVGVKRLAEDDVFAIAPGRTQHEPWGQGQGAVARFIVGPVWHDLLQTRAAGEVFEGARRALRAMLELLLVERVRGDVIE